MDDERYRELTSKGQELQEAADERGRVNNLSIDELSEVVNTGEMEPADVIGLLMQERSSSKWHQRAHGAAARVAKSVWSRAPSKLQNLAPWKLWLAGSSILLTNIAAVAGVSWLKQHNIKKISTVAMHMVQAMADAEGIEADPAVMGYVLSKLRKDRYIKMKLKSILNVHGGGREQLAMDRAAEFMANEAMKLVRQRSGPRLPKIAMTPPPPLGAGPDERGFVHPPGHMDPQTDIDMAQGMTQGTEFIGGHLSPAAMGRPMGEGEGDENMEHYEDAEQCIDDILDGVDPKDVVEALVEKAGLLKHMAAGRFETPREAEERKARMAKPTRARPGFEPHEGGNGPSPLRCIRVESLVNELSSEDLVNAFLDEAKKKEKPRTTKEKKNLYKKIATGAAVGLGTLGALALASHQGKKYLARYIKDVAAAATQEAQARAKAKLDKRLALVVQKDSERERRELRKSIKHTGLGVASVIGLTQAAGPAWAMIKSLTASADDMVTATLTESPTLIEAKKKRDFDYVGVNPRQRGRFKGVSVGKDKDGFFVMTHRASSKSYPSLQEIPDSIIKRIERTG